MNEWIFGEASSELLKSTDLQALAKTRGKSFRSEFAQFSKKTPQPAVLIVLESSQNFFSWELRVQSSEVSDQKAFFSGSCMWKWFSIADQQVSK